MRPPKGFWLGLLLAAVLGGGAWLAVKQGQPPNSKLPSAKHLPKDTLVFAINTEPPTLDTLKMNDGVSGMVIEKLMRGLTTFDAHGRTIPAVATHWMLDASGTHYRFFLRSDARWSDGVPVRSQQFVDAFQRALNRKNAASYAFFLFPIAGAEAVYKGTAPPSALGMHAPSPTELDITLKEPLAFFPSLLAFPIAMPIRQDLLAKYGTQLFEASHWVGNGPYHLAQWQHEQGLLLEPNPRYWGYRPSRPKLRFRIIADTGTAVMLFENGQLDMIESGASLSAFEYRRFRGHPWAKELPTEIIHYLGFNTQKSPFQRKEVRKAFCQALQKDWIPKLLQAGQQPLNSFVSTDLPGYDATLGLRHNAKAAQAAWQTYQAQHPQEAAAASGEITLGVRNTYDAKRIGEILRYQWHETLGANVRLKLSDWKVYLNELQQDAPPLFFLSWMADYPDADSFLGLFTSDNGNNHTHWQSPAYDALLARSRQTTQLPERVSLFKQAQKLAFEEEVCACPLYQLNKLYVLQPRVKGLAINPLSQLYLEEVRIESP